MQKIVRKIHDLPMHGRPRIVYICGIGGAGKTMFCSKMADIFKESSAVIHTDWYLLHESKERRKRIEEARCSGDASRMEQEENPIHWYDWKRFLDDVETFVSDGQLSLVNAWDQKTGQKNLSITLQLTNHPEGITFCDGIYLMHPPVCNAADLIILMRTPLEVAQERIIARDRHRSSAKHFADKILFTQKYDLPYFKKFLSAANVIVDNND